MRCRKARFLMLLYRDRELTPALHAALARHYAICPECAREAERVVAEFASVDALRGGHPVLADPALLTHRIMREIEHAGARKMTAGRAFSSRNGFLPVTRWVGAGAAVLLVLLYATLTYSDARTLAALEERFTQRKLGRGSIAEQLARDVALELESRDRRTFAEAGVTLDEAGRVLRFLVSPSHQPPPVTLEEFFLRKYPALASVTLQDGLDEKELSILSNDGERFLRDLEKLIRKEQATHAH